MGQGLAPLHGRGDGLGEARWAGWREGPRRGEAPQLLQTQRRDRSPGRQAALPGEPQGRRVAAIAVR